MHIGPIETFLHGSWCVLFSKCSLISQITGFVTLRMCGNANKELKINDKQGQKTDDIPPITRHHWWFGRPTTIMSNTRLKRGGGGGSDSFHKRCLDIDGTSWLVADTDHCRDQGINRRKLMSLLFRKHCYDQTEALYVLSPPRLSNVLSHWTLPLSRYEMIRPLDGLIESKTRKVRLL